MEGNWRQVLAEWRGGMGFVGCNQTGGEVQIGTIDGKPGVGPMEMLLLGLAGCTGMDIVSILEKKRQELQDLKIQVRGKRADTFPKVYTEIEVEYQLWGEDLDPKAVEQAIELSEQKYCSASIMLGATARIKTSYTIQNVLANSKA
jgi:putative redox protein